MSGAVLVGALAGPPSWGCVLPADLEPDVADAGPSSPPVVVGVSPPETYRLPGPIVVSREDSPLMGLIVRDNDVTDTLYVRLYVDYGANGPMDARPPRASCLEAANGTTERRVQCMTLALCSDIDPDDTETHVLEAMVADREFLPDNAPSMGQPLFRALADRERAGFSFVSWVMTCQ